jgi:hypothetical protein
MKEKTKLESASGMYLKLCLYARRKTIEEVIRNSNRKIIVVEASNLIVAPESHDSIASYQSPKPSDSDFGVASNEDLLEVDDEEINEEALEDAHVSGVFETRTAEYIIATDLPIQQPLMQEEDIPSPLTPTNTCSRVLKDVFHVFQMLKLPLRHGGRADFCRDLRDAILQMDMNDHEKVSQVLLSKGQDFETIMRYNPSYLWARIRRVIPHPMALYPKVVEVFNAHMDVVDQKTGMKLFNLEARKQAKSILELVAKGVLSDPHDVQLYYYLRTDADGLPIYRCIRGTNSLEGGVHQNIHRNFASYNAGPQLANCLLSVYCYRHNTKVC